MRVLTTFRVRLRRDEELLRRVRLRQVNYAS